jgi:DNA polymerase beta
LKYVSLAPLKSRGAAQLALTGDHEFLRIARLAAERHGMHLDEYGLWRWHDSLEGGSDRDVGAGYWELIEGENEERILEEIGLGDVPPARRNFRYLAGRRRVSARAGKIDLYVEQAMPKFPPKVGRPPAGGN